MAGNAHLGIQARGAAIKRLVKEHKDEFDGYHAEERVSRGLPANPEEAYRAKRVKSLLEQLEKLGYDPNNQ